MTHDQLTGVLFMVAVMSAAGLLIYIARAIKHLR